LEIAMTGVRLLIGTKKGAFVLESDGSRRSWSITGPHFAGWEVYHIQGSRANPDRLFASQSTGWYGQVVQRSDDGGVSWNPVGNDFRFEGVTDTHKYYDGSDRPWSFVRVWQFATAKDDPDFVLAGVEDAALFRSLDGGLTWSDLGALRDRANGREWQPGAGGMCLHSILVDDRDRSRIDVAISAAGVFGTTDGGASWAINTRGLQSEFLPSPDASIGHCVHAIARHADHPDTLFMQKHWDVMRSDDGGKNWFEISGDLPTDFGFVIGVHAHEPGTVYVVPITSDEQHFPPDGMLRVYRSRTGGGEWEPLDRGLPSAPSYVNVLRSALAIDELEECGVYFGTTGGQLYFSRDAGDQFEAIPTTFPSIYSVEVQTLP
jgi:hypothetical protein